MELRRQKRRRLQPYLGLGLGLIASAVMVVTGVVGLNQFRQPPPNPFAVYDSFIADSTSDTEFWSNHEAFARTAFDLACSTSLTEKYCVYQPETGPFEIIRFNDLNDEGESGIYFGVRKNALTIGEVALLWGKPQIEYLKDSVVLHWPDMYVKTVIHSSRRRFSYFLPVAYLLIGKSPE